MNAHAIRSHWFFWVAPLVLAADFYAALAARGAIDRVVEAGLLFDLAVLLPLLYLWCYRQRGRAALVRAAGVACLGIWLALKLVPEPERELLVYVAPLRYVGLAVLVWIEVRLMVVIYRSVFKGGSVEQAVEQAPSEMPRWVAKLLAMEARLWLRVWSAVKRLLGRR